jgi:hypothetical protein
VLQTSILSVCDPCYSVSIMRGKPQLVALDSRQADSDTQYSAGGYAYALAPSSSPYAGQLHNTLDEGGLSSNSYQQFLPTSSSLLRQPEAEILYNNRDLNGTRQDQSAYQSHSQFNARQQLDLNLPSTAAMTPYLQDGYNNAVLPYNQNLGSLPMMSGMMQQPRLPTSIHSRKPKTETKPMIDPVDNKQLCTFFMRTGTCAYGDRCRYKHPKDRPPPQVNSRGFPVREGEPDCEHYIKRGWCAFGVTCKFNHPESTAFVPMPYQQPGFVPMPGMVTVPYIPAYSYPAYTSVGLAAPAVYAQAGAYQGQQSALGLGMKHDGSVDNSSSDAVDEAAQSLEALTLRGHSPK